MKASQIHIIPLLKLLRQQDVVLLLESQLEEYAEGQKTLLAGKSQSYIYSKNGNTRVYEDSCERKVNVSSWNALQDFLNRHKWVFGYFGYDLKNEVENLTSENPALVDVPDMFFFVPHYLYEIDAEGNLKDLTGNGFPDSGTIKPYPALSLKQHYTLSKEQYISTVKDILNDIYEGEYYELNYTHALEFDFQGDPLTFFEYQREHNPVPFAAFFETESFTVCSASPERFLTRKNHRVRSQPMKGTASRITKSGEEVSAFQNSEKIKAENLMIVDLVRHDLNRVCKKNSVQVRKLFEVQEFNSLYQMVSVIEGEVDESMHDVEIIKACFPMGSMTGAPKFAVMNAIEKYENYRRGIYSGALGYFGPDGFDFNVLIRTAIFRGNKMIYPVGGAITSDSNPEEEWQETLLKAKGIIDYFSELKESH